MLRLTWGVLGGSVARQKVGAVAASVVSNTTRRQRASENPALGATSKSDRRVSRGGSPTRVRTSPRTVLPTSSRHTAGGAAAVKAGGKKSKGTKAQLHDEAERSSSVASVKPLEAKEGEDAYASARPAYMSAEREQEVLAMAERMQRHDLTTEVPVASFAYEILKAHPSVRTMGLRERMDFLLTRWSRLSKGKKLEYINDPLRGLL